MSIEISPIPLCLALLRSTGFVAALPVSSELISLPKVLLAFGLCLMTVPIDVGADLTVAAFLLQPIIGLALALPITLFIEGCAFLGEACDAGRGQLIASLYDPFSRGAQSSMAILFRSASWALLLVLGFFEQGVALLRESYHLFPTNQPLDWLGIEDLAHRSWALFLSAGSLYVIFAGGYLGVELIAAFCGKISGGGAFTGEAFLFKAVATVAILLLLLAQYGPADLLRLPI